MGTGWVAVGLVELFSLSVVSLSDGFYNLRHLQSLFGHLLAKIRRMKTGLKKKRCNQCFCQTIATGGLGNIKLKSVEKCLGCCIRKIWLFCVRYSGENWFNANDDVNRSRAKPKHWQNTTKQQAHRNLSKTAIGPRCCATRICYHFFFFSFVVYFVYAHLHFASVTNQPKE